MLIRLALPTLHFSHSAWMGGIWGIGVSVPAWAANEFASASILQPLVGFLSLFALALLVIGTLHFRAVLRGRVIQQQLRGSQQIADRRQTLMDAAATPLALFGRDSRLVESNLAWSVLTRGSDTFIEQARELAMRALRLNSEQVETVSLVIGGAMHAYSLRAQASQNGISVTATDMRQIESLMSQVSRLISAQDDVLDAVNAPIVIFGPERRIKFFNVAFARLFYLDDVWLTREPTLQELIDMLREKRQLPEVIDFAAYKREQLAQFQSLVAAKEEVLHLPDGRTLFQRVAPHPLGGLIYSYEDATDKFALERSYNTLIEVQRETLNNLSEGVAFFGIDRRLRLHNPAFLQIWGLSEEQLLGEPTLDELQAATLPWIVEGEESDPNGNPAVQRRIRNGMLSWRSGREPGKEIDFNSVPMPDGATLCLFLDITERNRAQLALRERNDALEAADRLKTEFIANVSYELRTPLNSIIGFSEILTEQYFGPLNARQLEYSRGILADSHRLLSLINDILDLATIEAGYLALERDTIEVNSLIVSTLALVRERAQARDISLTLDSAADIGTIIGDTKRLRQALFNLLSNAIKFCRPQDRVTIGARKEAQRGITISISDTGPGIPPESLPRIFGRFERAGRQAGAGLGLSLVRSIIELHGGDVSLTSSANGTEVICWLPESAPETPRALPPPVQQGDVP
ncbi:sensor histidine kinase [Elstera litoralis]|uniref:sensor histidine kinase n=1 Tax=Elstera litoralis TaxID=552518 RepID=UPI0009FEB4DB|nr:PAS domain-containing sensor histidine kinase [Elstera litoralis]